MKINSKKKLEKFRKFNTGENFQAYEVLGCHPNKKAGFEFAVWAPKAKEVSILGEFSDWETGELMEKVDGGVWYIHVPDAKKGQYYKYRVVGCDGVTRIKSDPFAFASELRPHDASIVYPLPTKKWNDNEWFARLKKKNMFEEPINIYEVHAGSWMKKDREQFYNFSELRENLIPYLKKMNYTHVEFMPLSEHPLDDSWGYQATGYFSLSARYGQMEDLMDFVEECHKENIGVLMDWVPGHFCVNENALVKFDGTNLYEYDEEIRAVNQGWGARNFDLGAPGVQSFLISSAFFWLELFHIDGLRVDAVSNMLYRDFDAGPWIPNEEGGAENFEGVHFLRKLNSLIKQYYPTALTIAEDSSTFPNVTKAVEDDGLGFDFKWNLGWMNDTLRFYQLDPIYRKYDYHLITFTFVYLNAERYLLPLSHDEVVHGKKSLLHKMFGDRDSQFAHLRNLLTFMTTHPGKQILFMGGEWGQFLEWRFYSSLEWKDLEDEANLKMQKFTQELNKFYLSEPALWSDDYNEAGIEIIDANNNEQSILSFIRWSKSKKEFVIVILNFTPVERPNFVIGVPKKGTYEEAFNSELTKFGGKQVRRHRAVKTKDKEHDKFKQSITTKLPALGVIILKLKK